MEGYEMKIPEPPFYPNIAAYGMTDKEYYLSFNIDGSDDKLPIDGLDIFSIKKDADLEETYDKIIHIEETTRKFKCWCEGYSRDYVNLIKSVYRLEMWKGMK